MLSHRPTGSTPLRSAQDDMGGYAAGARGVPRSERSRALGVPSLPPPYGQRCRFRKPHVEKGTCETVFSQVPIGYKAEGGLPHRRWYNIYNGPSGTPVPTGL